MIKNSHRLLLWFLAISILAHLLTAGGVALKQYLVSLEMAQNPTPPQQKVVIEKVFDLQDEEFLKIRPLGVKGGKPQTGIAPPSTPPKKGDREVDRSTNQKASARPPEPPQKLEKPTPNFPSAPDGTQVAQVKKSPESQREAAREEQMSKIGLEDLQQKIQMTNIPFPKFALNNITANKMGVQYDPPEGVSVDELNQLEQVFYSFNTRVYSISNNALQKAVWDVTLGGARKLELPDQTQEIVTGSITVNANGDVLETKIVKASDVKIINAVFGKLLENVQRFPNPPKVFFKKKDTFKLYLILYVQS